jgi:hypothetical protein
MKLKPDILFLQEIVPEHIPFPEDSIESINGSFINLVTKLKELDYKYYFIGDAHYSTKPNALDVNYPYFMPMKITR